MKHKESIEIILPLPESHNTVFAVTMLKANIYEKSQKIIPVR